jgi:hypothetical protein
VLLAPLRLAADSPPSVSVSVGLSWWRHWLHDLPIYGHTALRRLLSATPGMTTHLAAGGGSRIFATRSVVANLSEAVSRCGNQEHVHRQADYKAKREQFEGVIFRGHDSGLSRCSRESFGALSHRTPVFIMPMMSRLCARTALCRKCPLQRQRSREWQGEQPLSPSPKNAALAFLNLRQRGSRSRAQSSGHSRPYCSSRLCSLFCRTSCSGHSAMLGHQRGFGK